MWAPPVIERGDSNSYGDNVIGNKWECSRGKAAAAAGGADEHLMLRGTGSADSLADAGGSVSTLLLPRSPLSRGGGCQGPSGAHGGNVPVVSKRISDDVCSRARGGSEGVLAEPPSSSLLN